MSILAGLAAGMASSGMQQVFTEHNREADFRNYKEAQTMNNEFAQSQQYLSPQLTKLGMAAAGLNPSTMSATSAPASATSAPLATHQSPTVDFAASTAALADAREKNAEAEKTELQNEQTKHANESSFENYVKQIESVKKLYLSRGFTQQAQSLQEELDNLQQLKDAGKLSWNLGDLDGAIHAFGTADKVQERLQQQLVRQFETEKNFNLLVNGSSFEVAKMPKIQRELMEKQISLSAAQTALAASQNALNDENINYLVKEQEKINREIDELVARKELDKAQANVIKNADWKSLFRNGEFGAGAAAFIDDYTKEIIHALGGILNAGVAYVTGGKVAKSIGSLKQTTGSQQNNTAIYHYDSKGYLKGHDVIQGHQKRTMLNKSVPSSDNEDW